MYTNQIATACCRSKLLRAIVEEAGVLPTHSDSFENFKTAASFHSSNASTLVLAETLVKDLLANAKVQ